jgi:hypothetical protein
MMTIDNVINQMSETQCLDCYCESAIYDDTNEKVKLFGSFIYPQPNLQMIHIIAKNLDGSLVWEKECDTGKTCSIPFTSNEGMQCDPCKRE